MSPTTSILLPTLVTCLAALAAASPRAPRERLSPRAEYSGKMTWIGDTTGAYTSCGQQYEAGSMYVAVSPALNTCPVAGGTGSPMTITCNGQTVSAMAIDKCMGCSDDHIDVATAVYEACGFSTSDGGMQASGISWSF